ncbi:transporter [Natrinema zhouii]|uniref:Transporter n=1 Tax=Natrinema zhouii TaxID=1710539 RepID=A0A7D6CNE8_9EURY|nr:transporter [Natrinema zhouii]QLK25857.1 transporter [Natrinema zhouii]
MVKLSTIVILAGVVMLVFPIPPIASALGGVAVILAGLVLRFLMDR